MPARLTPRALLVALALSLVALPAGSALAKKTTVKMATLAPKGSAFHKVLAQLADDWKQASDGKVRLKIFPGGVAGDDSEVVRKVRLGTLQGGLVTAAGLREISKAAHALQVPLAFETWAEYDYVLEKMRPTLEAEYASKGFVILAWGDAGWVRILSKKRIVTPADAHAQKMFVFQGDPVQAELWKSSGFNVVPLPATEITTALQTGLIESVPTTAQAAVLMQWHQHAKHMTGSKWAPFVGALIIKKEVWEGIDPAVREKLAASAAAAGKRLEALSRAKDAESLAEMQKRGLTLHPADAETMKLWHAAVEKAMPGILKTFVEPALFNEAMKHRDAFRALGSFTDGQDE